VKAQRSEYYSQLKEFEAVQRKRNSVAPKPKQACAMQLRKRDSLRRKDDYLKETEFVKLVRQTRRAVAAPKEQGE
jgi:hypothetical protein